MNNYAAPNTEHEMFIVLVSNTVENLYKWKCGGFSLQCVGFFIKIFQPLFEAAFCKISFN